MIDLTWILGTYTPVIDPVTGSIPYGVSGLDWAYIARLILLIMCMSTVFMAFMRFIKGGR